MAAQYRVKKRTLVGLGLVVVIGCGVVAFRWHNYRSMISATLEWTRLAPFPDEVTDFQISTTGSMFSRAFRASFKAEPAVIDSWLEKSPGVQDAEIEERGTTVIYKIKPGGGAQHAEVKHDRRTNSVRVYTYWS